MGDITQQVFSEKTFKKESALLKVNTTVMINEGFPLEHSERKGYSHQGAMQMTSQDAMAPAPTTDQRRHAGLEVKEPVVMVPAYS